MKNIGLFAKALVKRWLALMSSAFFTALSFYTLSKKPSEAWQLSAYIVLAIVCFIVAAYGAWSEEHQRYEIEVTRNQQPDVRGEAFDFFVSVPYAIKESSTKVLVHVRYSIHVCNHRPVPSTIQQIKLSGMPVEEVAALRRDSPVGQVLEHGIGAFLNLSFGLSVPLTELGSTMDLTVLKIEIVDGFNNHHPVHIRDGHGVAPVQRLVVNSFGELAPQRSPAPDKVDSKRQQGSPK